MAEEKSAALTTKKVATEKKVVKATAASAEQKVGKAETVVKTAVPVVAKKPVEAKKVEKVAEPAVSPVKETKVAEAKVLVVAKKPAEEKKVAPKAAKPETIPVEKKAVTEKKAAEPAVSVKEKVVPEKKVSKPKVTPVKDVKVAEAEATSAEKTVPKEKAEPKVTKPKRRDWTVNPMLMPRIDKVTVNMSVGKSGTPLQQAVTILKQLTDQEPSKRAAKKTIREFGIRKGESIACLVTLRNEKAEAFLRKAFYAIDNKLSKYKFDRQGNFSFGIKEHIDIPGTKYAPELGIQGMDVSVSLGRAGYRVKRRHRAKSKIGKDHLLTADEAILFIKDEFDVEIT